ncbi:MAG: ROK family transcriptional regulator [Anaerolineales bacterium]
MKKATRQQTKEHNRNLVLKTIFEHPSVSRAEIGRITSLTPTTVSSIVANLMTEGLVNEMGVGASIGGKPGILLGLVDDARYLVGLDLGQNQFSGAVLNLRGEIKTITNLPVNNRNGDYALALVFEIVDRLVHDEFGPLVGIGVGTPGLVNTRDGVVISAVNLDWRDLALAQLLRDRYHLPVRVLNDSQAGAMGEYAYGGGHDDEGNLVVINVGNGIGAGILVGGHLFQGDGGAAGEIGHVVVMQDGGLPCRCGNRGCLETVASARAVLKRAQLMASHSADAVRASLSGEITLNDVEQAFVAGDPSVKQIVLEAGHYMGLAISSLVGTLNIRKIVLSGDMTRFGAPWLGAIRETMSGTALSSLTQETRVEIGQVSGNRVIMGAAALLLNDYSLLFSR